MQAALRSASRRAAAAASHRGVATTTTRTITEADKKWVESLVQREVRTQMLEAEWSARLRAVEREVEAPWEWLITWQKGFLAGYFSCFTGGVIGTLLFTR